MTTQIERDYIKALEKRIAELEAARTQPKQPAPDVQGESVTSAPVSAQLRFRHPQKAQQDWSVWQPATISLDRPAWEIDSQGFEVEYRLLYAAPQPAEQPTFSVGTDLSDGKLSVVVLKNENDITWVIHSEVIQLAEHQPDVAQQLEAADYKTWYEEATTRANEAGFSGMSAAQVIDYQDGEIMQLRASNARLAEALEEALHHVVISPGHVRGDFIQEIEAALAAHRKGGE